MKAELLALRDVAQITKYSPRHVRRLVDAGRFPAPVRVSGPTGRPRWLAATVEQWLLAHGGAGDRQGVTA